MGKPTIWRDLRGGSVLGEDDFVNTLSEFLKGQRDIREIPRSQRYLGRPKLQEIFSEKVRIKKTLRDEYVRAAVERHGYSQREVADHLGMHYSTISGIVNDKT